MTYDGIHSYTYDAENHLTQVDAGAAATYIYDPNGNRVRKNSGGSWTEYFYDMSGNVTAEHNSAGWPVEYVYVGGQLVAQYRDSTTYSIFRDHLGSTRLITKLDKSVYDSLDFLPFGEQLAGDTGTTHKFTSKERDSESGIDNFGARYDSSSLGRFMSPDPENISALLHDDDPQAWNGYAYGRNNPVLYTDSDGLNYTVCDANGKNCADLSDEQYRQYRKDNPDVHARPSGDLYIGNTKVGSESYYNEHALDNLVTAGNMAAPGVGLAANILRTWASIVFPPLMIAAECGAGGEGCTKGNVALAILPEVGALKEGALILKEGAAVGKAAEILQKSGGMVQAAKDFESLQGAEKVLGNTRVKELADGSKAVLYNSKGDSPTLAIQQGGRTVTKIRY
jgi:RHS repeat-associated protein